MATILARGQKSWSQAENKYLSQWRQWERDFADDQKAADDQWDAKIQEHFRKKEQWETDLRQKANAGQIEQVLGEAVDSLNAQMSQLSASGIQMPERNRLQTVNEALAQLKLNEPSNTERFQNVNKSISTFNTTIAVANLAKADFSGIDTLSANFRETMREQERNMRVQRNVALYEQYNDLIEDFKRQIEAQNRAVENATRSAAMQAGLFESGDLYIKKGVTSGFFGFVNKYNWFDTDAALDTAMTTSTGGLDFKKGPDLVKFLEEKDQVEVDAYFEVQTIALQSIFKKIAGAGTPEERQGSREEAVVGQLGMWIGEAPGQNENFQGLQSAASHYQPENLTKYSDAIQLTKFGALGGFGELGSFGSRPGGAPFGFYVQLDFISQAAGNADQAKFRRAQDWITTGESLMGVAAAIPGMGGGAAAIGAVYDLALGYAKGSAADKTGGDGWAEYRTGFYNATKRIGAAAAGSAAAGAGYAQYAAYAEAGATFTLAPLQRNADSGKYEYRVNDRAAATMAIAAIGAGATYVGGEYSSAAEAAEGAKANPQTLDRLNDLQMQQMMMQALHVTARAGNSAMRYDAYGRSQGISTDAWLENNFSSPEQWINGGIALGMGIAEGIDELNQPLGSGGSPMDAATQGNLWNVLGGVARWGMDLIADPFKTAGKGVSSTVNATLNWMAGRGYATDRELEFERVLQAAQANQNERNIDLNQAIYLSRELAAQLGIAKDGEGILYRDLQKRLEGVAKQNGGKVSVSDIEQAARDEARSLGLDGTGAIDWDAAAQGRRNAIGADMAAQQQRELQRQISELRKSQGMDGWELVGHDAERGTTAWSRREGNTEITQTNYRQREGAGAAPLNDVLDKFRITGGALSDAAHFLGDAALANIPGLASIQSKLKGLADSSKQAFQAEMERARAQAETESQSAMLGITTVAGNEFFDLASMLASPMDTVALFADLGASAAGLAQQIHNGNITGDDIARAVDALEGKIDEARALVEKARLGDHAARMGVAFGGGIAAASMFMMLSPGKANEARGLVKAMGGLKPSDVRRLYHELRPLVRELEGVGVLAPGEWRRIVKMNDEVYAFSQMSRFDRATRNVRFLENADDAVRGANAAEVVAGVRYAPENLSGFSQELQRSIMRNLPEGWTAVMRSKKNPYMDGLFDAKLMTDTPDGPDYKILGPNGQDTGLRRMIDKDGNSVIRKSDLDSYVFFNEKGEIADTDFVMRYMERVELDYGPRTMRGEKYDPDHPVVFGQHPDNFNGELELYYKAMEARRANEVVYMFNRDGFIAADKMNNVIGKLRTPTWNERIDIAQNRFSR